MLKHHHRPARLGGSRVTMRQTLLCGVAALALLGSPAVAASASDSGTLRIASLNVWVEKFRDQPEKIAEQFLKGNYDTIVFQELVSEQTLSKLQSLLAEAGAGDYRYIRQLDNGVLSRIDGTLGQSTQGDSVAWQLMEPGKGVPDTLLGVVHLDYHDPADLRLQEVDGITDWAAGVNRPTILVGDWNAGDVSERGLNRASQQKLILQDYLRSGNSYYRQLLTEYTVDAEAMEAFIADHTGESLSLDQIPDTFFADETYPIESNTPYTMNRMKRDYMLLQLDGEREGFAPHELADGSTTWPSVGEDATNVWASWDRTRIDHYLASRPFGKWWQIVDDPTDPNLGTLDDLRTEDGVPYADHAAVAHEFRWIGPKLEYYTGAEATEETRLVWGEGATTFSEENPEFFLTRNNMRSDVYLGQIADENGVPILTGLTLDEKKTLLDCTTDDPRLQQAVQDYCIDDHSFIGETLVADGGTVVVAEDAALGEADARLRLSNGGLAVIGTEMTTLDREISLEDEGGWLDVRSAGGAVEVAQAVSGSGDLIKRGVGSLTLAAENSYTGATRIEAGALIVNGSIATAGLTTVGDGARLGGTGTTGSVRVAEGGTLGAGNSIGTLNVAGDLSFASGSILEIEANADGEADKVAVSGDIAIEGGSAIALAEGGDYRPQTSYEVLSAGGTVSGRFDSITSSLAFLDAELSYGASSVDLTLDRNDTSFDTVAVSGNARAAATAIEALGMGNEVYDAVVLLGADTASDAFSQMSGEIHAATMGALANQSARVANVWGEKSRGASRMEREGLSFWASGYGENGTTKAGGDLSDVRNKTVGTLFGADALTENGLEIGVMTGFGQGEVSLSGRSGTVDTDDLHLGLSIGKQFGATILRGGLAYTHSTLSGSRDVSTTGFANTLSSGGHANTTHVFAELAHQMKTGNTLLEPFGSLSHIRVKTDGVSETGGSAALRKVGGSYDVTFAEVGLRLNTGIGASDKANLRSQIGWRHAFSGDPANASMAFAGGDAFGVSGAGLAQDRLSVGIAFDYAISESGVFSIGYNGAFGDDGDVSAFSAGFGFRF
ncbi:autotransporter domain-containing protein [Pseudodonghicola xiamenensis]|nr:autotransporter domain-containing protein [Pseudodonghicola xiamenensis]